MLTDEVEFAIAVGVRPEPSFIAVVAGTIAVAAGHIPEGNADVFTAEPAPAAAIRRIPAQAHPVLAVRIVPAVSKQITMKYNQKL